MAKWTKEQKQEILAFAETATIREAAVKFGVPEGTIKRWRSELRQKTEPNEPNRKSEPANQENEPKAVNVNTKSTRKKENESVGKSPKLTEKQKLFCLYYVKTFNATQSAIKAGYTKESAHVIGSNLLKNVKVKDKIRRLKGRLQDELFIDVMDVLNKYIAIAFADISDFLEFGQKQLLELNPVTGAPLIDKNGNQVTTTISYVSLKNSSDADTSVIAEVKKGKDGIGIKLVDRMQALEKLEKYFDLLPDHHKRRIEEANLQLSKDKLELEKQKAAKDDANSQTSDDWVDALEEIAKRRKEKQNEQGA